MPKAFAMPDYARLVEQTKAHAARLARLTPHTTDLAHEETVRLLAEVAEALWFLAEQQREGERISLAGLMR